MTTMHAVTFDAPGPPDALTLTEIPIPARVNGEVLVRVHAAGVNPVDAKTRAGRGAWHATHGLPTVLGNDVAGVVVEPAYDAHPLSPGTRVYGMGMVPRTPGAYAEFVSLPTTSLAKMPRRTDFIEAAAVPLAALTAWGMVVEIAKAHDGQRMLIHAGAGGVGHLAVQLASFFGAHVIATCSADNIDFVRALGAAEVVDYTAGPFEESVGTVDAVIDLIGNTAHDTGSRSLGTLRPAGLYVNAPTGSFPTMHEEADAAGVRATDFRVSPDAAALAVIARLIDARDLTVHVDRVLPLADAATAHRLIEAGHTRGKIVLSVAR